MYGKKQERKVFKSIKAVDGELLKSENIYLSELKGEELENYFKLSNFCLVTNKGHTHGPFGTNLLARKPVTICIDNGNVLDHATNNFIYANENSEHFAVSNVRCFSFYVSSHKSQNRTWDLSSFKYIKWTQFLLKILAKTKMHLLMLACIFQWYKWYRGDTLIVFGTTERWYCLLLWGSGSQNDEILFQI